MTNVLFTVTAWSQYVEWQSEDKKTLKRINLLIANAVRTPFEGIGKPEPLKENLSGFWSRRIDDHNRLIYSYSDNTLKIIACKSHYDCHVSK